MTNDRYPAEVLDEDDDDGTMVESLNDLREAVVGHRIVSIEALPEHPGYSGLYGGDTAHAITLDNGKRVRISGVGDCCAYTDLEAFLLHPERVDHAITGVGTTDGFTTWHIFCDFGDVAELTVKWSCGNPFYYGYGFTIAVEDLPDAKDASQIGGDDD